MKEMKEIFILTMKEKRKSQQFYINIHYLEKNYTDFLSFQPVDSIIFK